MRQLPFQVVFTGHVVDRDDVDQLVQLVDDLLHHRLRTLGHQGDPRTGPGRR